MDARAEDERVDSVLLHSRHFQHHCFRSWSYVTVPSSHTDVRIRVTQEQLPRWQRATMLRMNFNNHIKGYVTLTLDNQLVLVFLHFQSQGYGPGRNFQISGRNSGHPFLVAPI